MFDPIPQSPRYRLVADALAARIVDGSLPVGAKLPPDRVLVEQLGVSRATLREALIALEVMGFLETRFGSGAYVARKHSATARPPQTSETTRLGQHADPQSTLSHGPFETLEARRLIEGELTALAAEQVMPHHLDRLWQAVSQMESALDWDAEADQSFHRIIAEAAGNAVLAAFAARFWTERKDDPLWKSIETAVQDSNRRPALVAEHEAIIEALTEGDPAAARRAMHRHLDSFSETLLAQLDAPDGDSAEAAPHARLKSALDQAG
jgi:DNA-binding FadR family transcriptional regulator